MVENTSDSKAATEEMLKRITRYEIFWNIDLEGLLHIHSKIMERYADNPTQKYILSSGGMFLVSFAAACGKVRNMLNMTSLEGALQRMMKELDKADEDPLNLDEYQRVLNSIKTSRGKAIRRLVYDTFLRFFNGATSELDWADAARQITL